MFSSILVWVSPWHSLARSRTANEVSVRNFLSRSLFSTPPATRGPIGRSSGNKFPHWCAHRLHLVVARRVLCWSPWDHCEFVFEIRPSELERGNHPEARTCRRLTCCSVGLQAPLPRSIDSAYEATGRSSRERQLFTTGSNRISTNSGSRRLLFPPRWASAVFVRRTPSSST